MKKKKTALIKEVLPEYILEYMIHLDSGCDPYMSFINLCKRESEDIFKKELEKAKNRTDIGMTFSKSLSMITDTFYDPYIDAFIRMIIRGYVKGSDSLSNDLRILIERILHQDIIEMRENADKANTKLTFPISIIFISIILIAVYPALSQINI